MVTRVVFTVNEQKAMTEMPEVLRCLAYRHECMAEMADTIEMNNEAGLHRKRASELRQLATHVNECKKAGDAPYDTE